jgi:TonB family protein
MAPTLTQGSYRGHRISAAIAALAFVLASLFSNSAPRLQSQTAQTTSTAPKSRRKVVVSYAPVYPFVLQNGHFEGQVRLEATVQANGNVSHVETKGGNPMLAQYAMEAVLKWKYAPAPAATVEEVSFHFDSNSPAK